MTGKQKLLPGINRHTDMRIEHLAKQTSKQKPSPTGVITLVEQILLQGTQHRSGFTAPRSPFHGPVSPGETHHHRSTEKPSARAQLALPPSSEEAWVCAAGRSAQNTRPRAQNKMKNALLRMSKLGRLMNDFS